jgi:tetratricopeptide (TPR) repeat protein
LAIKFDPELAEPYRLLGDLLYQEERLDEAIEIYQAGLNARQARKSDLLSGVGKAYELKKKYRKAIAHYRKALRHSAELRTCIILEEYIKRCRRKQR